MRGVRWACLIGGLLSCFLADAQVITEWALGDGLTIQAADSSFQTTIWGRFQTRFSSAAALQNGVAPADFESRTAIQRARLGFKGYIYDSKLRYNIELGFSQQDMLLELPDGTGQSPILDAYLAWKLHPNLELRFGQDRLPGNRERMATSRHLQFVDRSFASEMFMLDRDIGMQLHHTHQLGRAKLREILAASQGDGRSVGLQNMGGYQYTARIEVLPLGDFANNGQLWYGDLEREPKPRLAIGATADYSDNAVRQRGNLGPVLPTERDLTTFMLDAMFKYRGLSASAEGFYRSTSKPAFYDKTTGAFAGAFYTGWGATVQAGFVQKYNWELAGRFSFVEPERATGQPVVREYTLGLNKYVAEHMLKVQGDASLTAIGAANPVLTLRLQVEAGF